MNLIKRHPTLHYLQAIILSGVSIDSRGDISVCDNVINYREGLYENIIDASNAPYNDLTGNTKSNQHNLDFRVTNIGSNREVDKQLRHLDTYSTHIPILAIEDVWKYSTIQKLILSSKMVMQY